MAPTTDQILEIARKAIKIFGKYGLECCLMGSVASYLYGVDRAPNDVDLVILSTRYTQEELKQILVREDPKFYRLASKNRFASYTVLWYSLSTRTYAYPNARVDCKVDLLIPGILNIPSIPPAHVQTLAGLPVMPLVPQLLLKLQGWSDHRASHRSDMQAKQYVDIRDVDTLLAIALERGAKLRVDDEDADDWVPESMITVAQGRLRSYTLFGSRKSADGWKQLGFVGRYVV
ncbi:hypothetical protein C8Q76DRAFT_770360 [Earliella scabrosa]|nr:hypothetical protein C8Q76DRAFT_770360 [Earliella scabrosa]